MGFFGKYLPSIAFVVASTALSFQTMVLYPWHKELEDEFKAMREHKIVQD